MGGRGAVIPELEPLPMPEGAPVEARPARPPEPYPPSAGFAGKTGQVANIASNFLQGWLRGKQTKEMMNLKKAKEDMDTRQWAHNRAREEYTGFLRQIGYKEEKDLTPEERQAKSELEGRV